jgi:Lysozyme like domain
MILIIPLIIAAAALVIYLALPSVTGGEERQPEAGEGPTPSEGAGLQMDASPSRPWSSDEGRFDATALLSLAQSAGFTGDDTVTAAAIALAESGGNSRAYNPEKALNTPPGKGSYGLWQIYLYKHPEFEGMDLYDAQTNANAAYSVYRQQGFNAWTTFKNQAYRDHMDTVRSVMEA